VIECLSDTKSTAFNEIYSQAIPWDGAYDDASVWMEAVQSLLRKMSEAFGGSLQSVKSICVSGTSASCLIVNSLDAGKVTRSPRMYDYDVVGSPKDLIYGIRAMELLDKHAPPRHTARAKTGSLAKLLSWNEERRLEKGEVLCHQADYIAMRLMSNPKKCGPGQEAQRCVVRSDWHNCLKCGYDVRNLTWPDWLSACLEEAGISDPIGSGVVPLHVVSPGEPLGTINQVVAKEFDLPETTVVVGGTTDSNAAFFAAVGGFETAVGTAVTSLGSTLAMKQLSSSFVEDADRGVYSHRFPVFSNDGVDREAWLIGGASNVGCAVLRQQGFSNEELEDLSKEIDPMSDIDLSYYPLTKKGERFPIADTEKEPIIEPVPESRRDYLHGLLQGISDVERDGFKILGELGATPSRPSVVWTCGGGSRNGMWSLMRQRRLSASFHDESIMVKRAENTEASYGSAILAAATFV
jgi:xylulokinase